MHGNPVHLTPKEYEVLELLSLRKGTILTKEMFFDHVSSGGAAPEHKISMSSSVSCAKSWPRRPVAVITSRLCGVAAMSF